MNSDESSVCSNDSIWDSDAESDCESLCSFDVAGEDGHELEEENGRRYNAFPSDAYQFPVDQVCCELLFWKEPSFANANIRKSKIAPTSSTAPCCGCLMASFTPPRCKSPRESWMS